MTNPLDYAKSLTENFLDKLGQIEEFLERAPLLVQKDLPPDITQGFVSGFASALVGNGMAAAGGAALKIFLGSNEALKSGGQFAAKVVTEALAKSLVKMSLGIALGAAASAAGSAAVSGAKDPSWFETILEFFLGKPALPFSFPMRSLTKFLKL